MIILASSSPRRRELFSKVAQEFTVIAPDADEKTALVKPNKIVTELAERKALCVFRSHPSDIVVSCDTVVYDGEVLNKPKDEAKAAKCLKRLSGRWHKVYSGVCILSPKGKDVFYEMTAVKFKKLTDGEIEDYIKKFNPLDKAGAYGIQDNVCVEKIRGDYYNVVGLPVKKLSRIIRRHYA